jgi:hypothetical protein
MQIRTDHKRRFFAYRSEVPEKVLADQFAHLNEDDAIDGFFRYRGHWYHLSDFLRFSDSALAEDFEGWDGYHSDSVFSGVLVKVSRDGEKYQVATYLA